MALEFRAPPQYWLAGALFGLLLSALGGPLAISRMPRFALPAPELSGIQAQACPTGSIGNSSDCTGEWAENLALSVDSDLLVASALESDLFDLANADRLSYGLPALEFAPVLLDAARQRASAQVNEPTLNHYDSAGNVACIGVLRASGLVFRLAGENLARGNTETMDLADRVETSLMASELHRANILDPRFRYLAVGSVEDSQGKTIFAQVFVDTS